MRRTLIAAAMTAMIGVVSWRLLAAPTGDGSGLEETGHRRADSEPRPPQIASLTPEEDGVAPPGSEIGATFRLEGEMLEDDEVDAPAFSLTLDGEDVKTDIRGTMDFPQSQAEVFHQPRTPLPPGRHRASVSFPDEKGVRQTYSWMFEVWRS